MHTIKAVQRLHLWLETGDGMLLGLGRIQLLELVEELGSLNKAASAMGMSYRAAWGRMKQTETVIGEALWSVRVRKKAFASHPLATTSCGSFASGTRTWKPLPWPGPRNFSPGRPNRTTKTIPKSPLLPEACRCFLVCVSR